MMFELQSFLSGQYAKVYVHGDNIHATAAAIINKWMVNNNLAKPAISPVNIIGVGTSTDPEMVKLTSWRGIYGYFNGVFHCRGAGLESNGI